MRAAAGGRRRHDTLSMTARHFCMSARNLHTQQVTSGVVAAKGAVEVVVVKGAVEVVVVLLDDDDKRDGRAVHTEQPAATASRSLGEQWSERGKAPVELRQTHLERH